MTNHSWNNKGIQGAILAQNSQLSSQNSQENISIKNNDIHSSLTSAGNLFIISKAYIEPQIFTNIENLLLQRDFIID